MENQYILNVPHMTMQDLEKILAFCFKCAKLALSLIITMACVYKSKILYNNIFPSNTLLHFHPNYVDRIYIRVCEWGMASHIVEDVWLSLNGLVYGYPKMVEMERNKREHYWVALELFYVYGPSNSETSLECVEKRDMYTKEAYAYSVGKKAQHIWKEE
jgi:hypothetical protein